MKRSTSTGGGEKRRLEIVSKRSEEGVNNVIISCCAQSYRPFIFIDSGLIEKIYIQLISQTW